MKDNPCWNLDFAYVDQDDPKYKGDLNKIEKWIQDFQNEISKNGSPNGLSVDLVRCLTKIAKSIDVTFWNLYTFVNCKGAEDATSPIWSIEKSRLDALHSKIQSMKTDWEDAISLWSDESFSEYLSHPENKAEAYYWLQFRKNTKHRLSRPEEKVVARLEQFGLAAWGQLYNENLASLKIQTKTFGELSVSQAVGHLGSDDRSIRMEVANASTKAWDSVKIPCAAVLNNIAGYRIEECRIRGFYGQNDFFEPALLENRIQLKTVESMFNAVQTRIDLVSRVLKVFKQKLDVQNLDWFDLGASPIRKEKSEVSVATATQWIKNAVTTVHPSISDFVQMMFDRQLVETRVLPSKKSGGFCSSFLKDNVPVVYLSYHGKRSDCRTLAHELGHAFHHWTIRDLDWYQKHYPKTLAETASIFTQNLVADYLFEQASQDEQFDVSWLEANDVVTHLADVSSRWDFEMNFYQQRKNGILSATQLSDLMEKSMRKWYGPELGGVNRLFWASKMHFSLTYARFYNFPYIFGYLFSQGLLDLFKSNPKDFFPAYTNLLKDTGQADVEEIALKHLGVDLSQPDFWDRALNRIDHKVQVFEQLAKKDI